MRVKRSRSFSGSGWENSTNSNPSVPAGLSLVISAGGASCGKGPMALPPQGNYCAQDTPRIMQCLCNLRAIGPSYARSTHRLEFSRMTEELDSFDIKILEALQKDGRLTNNELADH